MSSLNITNTDSIFKNLKKNGYAQVDELFETDLVNKVKSDYECIFTQTHLSKDKLPGLSVNKKLVKYLNFPMVISESSLKFALNKDVINIASKYLEDDVVLSYVVAYRTQETSEALHYYYNTPGVFSGWHSDNQFKTRGHKMLTVMIYLSDVNEKNGPLEVAEGTHDLNLSKRIFFENDLENFNKVKLMGKIGTTIFFDMDSVHKANVPKFGYRDVLRFSFSPKNGYKEKLFFIKEKFENIDPNLKKIISYDDNKDNYQNYKYKKNKTGIKKKLEIFKELVVFYFCHIKLFSKWYLKRRIRILKKQNM